MYFVRSTDIEPVPFNRGFYSVDLKYFFRITLAVFTGASRPTTVEGLATFNKKVILFGSEGNAKMFESKYKEDAFDQQLWKKTNMPHAVVEVVEPITLGAKLVDVRRGCSNNCCCDDDFDLASVPESVCRVFDDEFIVSGEAKRVFVSLGIFSIIKLERKVQLMVPCYDFCVPQKECVGATAPTRYRPILSGMFVCRRYVHILSFILLFPAIRLARHSHFNKSGAICFFLCKLLINRLHKQRRS